MPWRGDGSPSTSSAFLPQTPPPFRSHRVRVHVRPGSATVRLPPSGETDLCCAIFVSPRRRSMYLVGHIYFTSTDSSNMYFHMPRRCFGFFFLPLSRGLLDSSIAPLYLLPCLLLKFTPENLPLHPVSATAGALPTWTANHAA